MDTADVGWIGATNQLVSSERSRRSREPESLGNSIAHATPGVAFTMLFLPSGEPR
jgi:hypothetical protein